MPIYVIKPGDSIYKISRLFNISSKEIIEANELREPDKLAQGSAIFIPEKVRKHFVAPGQSLYSIAKTYNTTIKDIILANPQLTNPASIYPGMVINIPKSEKKVPLLVNGYSFPQINKLILDKTLPYLDFLSIFSYEVKEDGTLNPINDDTLINAALSKNVKPVMVITNIKEGRGFSSELVSTILNSAALRKTLTDNVLKIMDQKKYTGLNIDFEYLYPKDREQYNLYLKEIKPILQSKGYKLFTAVAPKTSGDQKGLLYEAHDYEAHGRYCDYVIIMTYEWGYTYGPPKAVAPLNEVKKVLDYAVEVIPPQKILMGIPNYGYDWTLPYVKGTAAKVISNTEAVRLAYNEGAAIQYDIKSRTPFFNYNDDKGKQHVVWFEDVRSIKAKLDLAIQYNLAGISYWTIGRYFPQNYALLKEIKG